ncbi:hypothetical protein NG895_00670 [Aeoliella sp. ICT_H6.2]|uniref:Uncharacterized protein n=1 Tax=Aeoliella straminimaris TaxID=2954799 RepID=A0A9X2F660_9BACT|nr:hypothetical protein [Aeoliella straminimaris]MCO6042408.1 hypothetical protein [Aeoliella straminimaris]
MLKIPTIRLAIVSVVAVMVAAPAVAQIRLKLGDDFKPRIEFNRDNDDGNKVEDRRWRGDDPKYDGNRNGRQENWVIRPGTNPQVKIVPNLGGRDATFVIRSGSYKGQHHGSYYCKGDKYYYVPWVDHSHNHNHASPQPVVMTFGGYTHVDELALALETQLNELCLDLHYNYQHNHGYVETYTEAYSLLQTAKHVHAAEHQGDRETIRQHLGGMDSLFHHIEDDVRGWSRHQHRQIGQGGLLTKCEQVEATLHHLMYDVGVHLAAAGEQAPPPPGYEEQAPPPPITPPTTPPVTPKVGSPT